MPSGTTTAVPVSAEKPSQPRASPFEQVAEDRPSQSANAVEEEGVEVILGATGGATKVVDSPERPRSAQDKQNVFRNSSSQSAGNGARPPASRPPASHSMGSGSFGYGPPPGDYPHHHPVPYHGSGSFEEHAYQQRQQQQHYSPHIQYPQPGYRPSEDVNVISPSHQKSAEGTPPYQNRPPRTPAGPQNRHAPPPNYYHYPPTSPVSRMDGSHSPPRNRQGGRRAAEPPPSYHPDDGTWNAFPPEHRPQPGLVTESSFDSEQYPGSHHSSQFSPHPPTPGSGYPGAPPPAPPTPSGPYYDQHQFYGGGSWGSFDSHPVGPPPQFDDQRYYGYPPPPESPYGQFSQPPPYYPGEAYPPPYPYGPPNGYEGYHPDGPVPSVTPHGKGMMHHHSPGGMHSAGDETPPSSNAGKGMMLPQAAFEVNFEVTNPPSDPFLPAGIHPCCRSPAEINKDDVLCGRGGGTNSQIGNRRFRKLVQEFQPTYLMARRKEKPRLARTIVLIIRNRGGRFLKKDEDTGELYEVGDSKAEAKTSQALREGLDVRATKSTSLPKKSKKKKADKDDTAKGEEEKKMQDSPASSRGTKEQKDEDDDIMDSPPALKTATSSSSTKTPRSKTPSPPPPPQLPQLKSDAPAPASSAIVTTRPHSPEALQFRKRRRMRSGGCVPFQDKLFPDFCPPRADLCRAPSPTMDEAQQNAMNVADTPPRRNQSKDAGEEVNRYTENVPQPGCADIAMMMMTGASGGFCVGPKWRSSN